MSDQADLSKVIEDVLLSTFENNENGAQNDTNPEHDIDKKLDDEIDYNEQLASLLGSVESHAKDAAGNTHRDEHSHGDKSQDEGEDYQIDFANVVQGIMDQYGDEEEEVQEVPAGPTGSTATEHEKINDSINEVVNDNSTKVNAGEKKTDDAEDENDFQDILAQLANEAVDKVRDSTTDNTEINPKYEPSEELKVSLTQATSDNQLVDTEKRKSFNTDENKDKNGQHEKELKDAINHALLSTNLTAPKSDDKEVPTLKLKEHILTGKPLLQSQSIQKQKPQAKVHEKERPLKQQHEQLVAPEEFFGELEKLAGADETDDLQAAFAQMVRNVVEGNESMSDSFGDDSSSDSDSNNDDGLPIDQSQMNEILHNAFQLAMDQQTLENDQPKDVNLNQHKAALDDAISSIFTGDRSKLKQLPKLKKDPVAVTKKKQEKIVKPTKEPLEPVKQKKVYPKKVVTLPEEKHENYKPATKPPHIPETPATAPVVLKTVTPNTDTDKKNTKLSIAQTLALTRSSMKAAPKRDYANIETLEQVLKVTEKQVLLQKQPGVSTFQSTSAKKSSLEEAIQQMSNALQSSSAQPKPRPVTPSSQQQNQQQQRQPLQPQSKSKIHTLPVKLRQVQQQQLNQPSQHLSTTPLSPSNATNPPAAKNDNEKGLLDALLLAKQFMSQQSVKESAAETLNVINSAIDSLKKPEVSTTNNTPFSNVSSSSMTAAITQAITNFAGSVSSSRPRSGQSKRNRHNYDAPELKEKIRQSNRERKKKWREINAERNKDNDLRFRVLKRANQLYGEADTDEKTNWIQEELDKRKKKRMERSSHSLKPLDKYDFHSGSDSNESYTKPLPQVKKEATSSLINPTLIKSIIDAFGNRNINSSVASAIAVSAIQALKSNSTDQQQITNAITNTISSITNNSNIQKTFQDNVTGVPNGAISSFKIQTPDDFSKQKVSETLKSNAQSGEKELVQHSDHNLTKLITNSVSTVIDKPKTDAPSLPPATATNANPLLAAAEATRKMMTKHKDGIATSLKNLDLSGSPPYENFTTTKSPQAEKRKSDDNLLSEELKKPRSVSPHAPQLALMFGESTSTKVKLQEPATKPQTLINSPLVGEITIKKSQAHEQEQLQHRQAFSRRPSMSFQGQSQNHQQQEQQHQQQQQQGNTILEPFKMLWSSRTAFRLPQYKKPVSDFERSTSTTPPPRQSSQAENSTPRRPLQRPGFSKPPAFQRPRW